MVLTSFVITFPTLVNTSTSDHEKPGKVRQHWRQKEKETWVRIK